MADFDIFKILNPNLTDLDKDLMADEYNKQLFAESLPITETVTAPPPVTRDPFAAPDLPKVPVNPPAPAAPAAPAKIAAPPQAQPDMTAMAQAPAEPPKPKFDYETFLMDQMKNIQGMEAPQLEQDNNYLAMLKNAQEKEKTERLFDALGRAGIMAGTALGGQGYIAPDFTLMDTLAKNIGQDKRNINEREEKRAAMAREKYQSAKDQYDAKRTQIKDISATGKELQTNRDDQRRLGMEAIRLDDQLENSKSNRETAALGRKRDQVALDLARLQLRDTKAKADPTSMISETARTMYARELESIDRADVAAQIATGNMSAKQVEDLLGSMNLSNLVTNFQNNLVKKEVAAAKKEEKEEKHKSDFEARIDKIRNSEFTKITEGYNKSMASLGNLTYLRDQKSGSGDMAILYDVIKAMDPDSVVREGEINLAKATAGRLDLLKNIPSKLTKGTVLGPDQRKELTKVAQYAAAKSASKKVIQALPGARSMIKQAEDMGMDRDEVLLRLVPPEIKGVLDEQLRGSEAKEAAVDRFMQDNGIKTRAEAVRILREAGKI